jgi:hypothetical protein
VEIGNAEALAERLARFANDPELDARRPLLISSIESRFSPDIVLEQWKPLLEAPPCE